MTQHDLFGDLLPPIQPQPAQAPARAARRPRLPAAKEAEQIGQLSLLIREAAADLSSATSAAEILESREKARAAVAAAEGAARLAKAGRAHAEVLTALHRAQGAAMIVEFHAKIRLADEYQAAVERGEVAVRGRPQKVAGADNLPTVAELGLSRQEIHQGRLAAAAERAAPGTIRAALDQMLAANKPPSRAGVVRAVRAVGEQPRAASGATRRHDIVRLCKALSAALDDGGPFDPKTRLALEEVRGLIGRRL